MGNWKIENDRNIFGSSWKVFSNLRKSSKIAGKCSFGLQKSFGKSSEIFGKWSEIFTPQKIVQNAVISMSGGKNNISRVSVVSSCHLNIKFISSRHRVKSSSY